MEENNSILLRLCSQKNFGEIFSKFPGGAALISPGMNILWCNDGFNRLMGKNNPLEGLALLSYKEGAQVKFIECGGLSGFLRFFPIIYGGQFLGYTLVFTPGTKDSRPGATELNAAKHDLNNLLTIVLNLISQTGKADLVSEGLALTKDFLNGLSGHNEETRLYIYDALSLIYHTYKASGAKSIAFNASIPSNLYPVRINKAKFIRVVSNLITNAVEAVKENGAVTLSAFNLNDGGKDYVCVCVADNGKGIPEQNLKSLFDKYFSTKERGSGLGLYIVKNIMEEMNGSVEVQNRINEGAKFILKFPAVRKDKKEIAIVEDEPMLNEVLSSQFSDDYKTHSFLDAESFLEKAVTLPISLAIIDKKLPGMSGLECINKLRELNSGIKIVLASGSAPGINGGGIRGVDRFVEKPYNFDQLFSAVEELLA